MVFISLHLQSNAKVVVEVLDAYEGRAIDASAKFCREDVNPATGPIFVCGAMPGDVLAIRICAIHPAGIGYAGIGAGALSGRISERLIQQFEIGDAIHFSRGITLIPQPMIGVIGVAPCAGRLSTMDAGAHGGNMDCNLARAGATVYLPVFVEGGLLAIGDVHALMGDGEVGGQGIEVTAEVELEIGIIKNWSLKRPMIETDDVWATVAAGDDFESAVWMAVHDMVDFLTSQLNITDGEALLLISLTGDVRVCQIVTSTPTARVEFPERLLSNG
ncbi:MAG TPA: acetamidase [Armatimonadetes bacterium]|nr:acetamidase [Armatimonadota bacterium]